ncbi:MAG: C1 family peptidase, partial [Planctomycetota bacterium]
MYGSYETIRIADTEERVGTGWLPPLPDFRDYTEQESDIPAMAKKLGIAAAKRGPSLPPKTDLRRWCSPIENQG